MSACPDPVTGSRIRRSPDARILRPVCFHRPCCHSGVFVGRVPRTRQRGSLSMRAVTRFVVATAVAASAVLIVPATTATASAPSAAARQASAPTPRRDVVPIPGQPATYKRFSPLALHAARSGPRFNNPYGSQVGAAHAAHPRDQSGQERARLPAPRGHRPGHRQEGGLPDEPGGVPVRRSGSRSTRSRTSRFVDALIDAHQRCVCVKLLMNSPPQLGQLAVVAAAGQRPRRHVGGNFVNQRSYAYRCSNGCLGTHRAAHEVLPVQRRPARSRTP